MAAGSEREAALRIADRLCAEVGCDEGDVDNGDADSAIDRREQKIWGVLSAEDESLVAAIRDRLAKLAAAIAAGPLEGATREAVTSALDGTELVMGGELTRGNSMHLLALMPSFVFLVTLPIAQHDGALELSRRTSELIEELEN